VHVIYRGVSLDRGCTPGRVWPGARRLLLVGTVAPGLGVPLVDLQRILDKMEGQGLVECTVRNPRQCRLTTWGQEHLERQACRTAIASDEHTGD